MDTKPRSVCRVGFVSALLLASSATAFGQPQPPAPAQAGQAQPELQNAAPSTAAPPPATPPAQPSAAQPPAVAPGSPPPTPYYPPPYYPPPGYPPPGYPPGYAPPPGYYPPPPGYPPVYYRQPDSGPPPGYHQHDGFYMRLATGVGVLSAKDSSSGQNETISGGGIAMAFAFGGAVTPNLILYGELSITSATSPTLESDGRSQTLSGNVNLFGIGPGVAYYFEPSNLYVSGSLTFSQVTESNNNSSDSSDSVDITEMGIGTNLMVGKEWWVSPNWGLGAAGYLQLASMKMKNYDSRMTAAALGVLFSATYN